MISTSIDHQAHTVIRTSTKKVNYSNNQQLKNIQQ